MIYEKLPLDCRPFIHGEVPYGFKQLWKIDVADYDLASTTFPVTNINRVILNGHEVSVDQMIQLMDYTRDLSSLTSAGANGLMVSIDSYNSDTGVFTFSVLAEQTLDITGVLGVTGDMVDNTDPTRPVVMHDTQKLDVTQYATDMGTLETRLVGDEDDILQLQNQVNGLEVGALSGIDLNGMGVPVLDNRAQLTIDYVSTTDFGTALNTKVDKTTAGSLVSDSSSTLGANGVLNVITTKRDLTTGSDTPTTQQIDLKTGLGIDVLQSLDFEHIYFFDSDSIPDFQVPVDVPLSALYRYNADGSKLLPSSTDDVVLIFAQAEDYSDFNVLRRLYVIAVGEVLNYTSSILTTSFTRMGATRIYNQCNAIRQGTIVYSVPLGATFFVLQNVPRPTSAATVIPITNEAYFRPLKDYSPMNPGTVFANFETTIGAGDAYPIDRTRLELIKLGSGYGDYIQFKTATIPSAINNINDWNTNVDLWVTDGYQFTSLDSLLTYLTNFSSAERFKMSNNGLVRSQYTAGGISLTPVFTTATIEAGMDTIYQPIVGPGYSGQLSQYDSNGVLAPSTFTPASFATMAQGAKADTAVQVITLQPGATNGTVTLGVDGVETVVPVPGLGTAAFQPSTAFATAAQGILADSSIQSVTLAQGGINGTLHIVVDGTPGADISVAGLGSAAYQNIAAFATAAQGALADTAVQTITFTPGTTNGTFLASINGGLAQEVAIGGLGSAAYQAISAFASAAQGVLADTALQRSDVVDSSTSAAVDLPGSANQIRLLKQRIDAMSGSGRPIVGFSTYAERYTNTAQYATDLQPIVVGDEIYIAADENHTNLPARYRVAVISGAGDITYSFLGIVPEVGRDFVYSPIQSNELADGAVGSAHLQGQSVTTPKIANNAVTLSKLSSTVQASLTKADDSLQGPITVSGSGPVVSSVRVGAGNILEVTQNNLSQIMTVNVAGGGDFITNATLSTNRLELTKDGTAIQSVQYSGSGEVLTGATVTGNTLVLSRGSSFGGLNVIGQGNAIVNATTNGTLTKGTLVSNVAKTGTGNVLTGVVQDTYGNVSLSSGNAYTNLVAQGSGAFITNITASDGTLTFNRGDAITAIPDATTTQKGVVQLNNTVTSTSTTLALTAAQGKVLQDQLNTIPGNYVALTGNQTIADIKIFQMHPSVPSKTLMPEVPLDTQYATEAQVGTKLKRPSVGVENNLVLFGVGQEVKDSGIQIGAIPTVAITDADIDIYVNNVWGA